jgi:hypothetical protein
VKGFSHILKGLGGEYELLRTCGAFGIVVYILSAVAFQGWNMLRGHDFDVTAYCLAFSGGLVAAVGGVAGAVAVKDRNVATARATDTGAAQEPQP